MHAPSSPVDGSGTCWKDPTGCEGHKFSSQSLYSSLAVGVLSLKRDGDIIEDFLGTLHGRQTLGAL